MSAVANNLFHRLPDPIPSLILSYAYGTDLITDVHFALRLAQQPETEQAVRAAERHRSRFLSRLQALLDLRNFRS